MSFDNDLFISYAHIDNAPLAAMQEGWVTRFHLSLTSLLSMRLGKQARIWRDQKLSGTDAFESRIVSQFPRSALLLSIVSPRYVESAWCVREVTEFCKIAATQPYGLTIDNSCRVVKVVKTPPITEEQLPAVMQTVLGHEFYQIKENSPVELDPFFGSELGEKYLLRVSKLAWELSLVLKQLDNVMPDGTMIGERKEHKGVKTMPTVYLAECSYDQKDLREQIDAELKSYGYRVLPQCPLARDETTFCAQVQELLGQCQLSIHLIGSNYGAVPDGPSQKSIVVLQNEIATLLSHERNLPRILRLAEDTVSRQPDQGAFIEMVKTDPETQFGADVITSQSPEELKGAIHAALEKFRTPSVEELPPSASTDRRLVYLICTVQDRRSTVPIRQRLNALGYEVELPVFQGSAEEVREANQSLLQQSVGIIVFYGLGSEAWKLSVKNELRRFQGVSSKKTKSPVYTYLAAPETEAKHDLIDMGEPFLLDAMQGDSAQILSPFTQVLEQDSR
ncbi:toll/interleukin-1 receptor domain-containing protein [Granulicella arctica]|uniref:toll/interleukin-1 receptor domain-containing protein n=1 Tax=Granulicella arctica TaxID=940613 RepID=UPI0021DF64B7|nr:toll/interleukin-1 receptor domain-containing protein [Granulicella arctica]